MAALCVWSKGERDDCYVSFWIGHRNEEILQQLGEKVQVEVGWDGEIAKLQMCWGWNDWMLT